jgi:SAM-dependent methyltransferase
MWMPTANNLVTEMLEAAQITSTDVVVDLGAGDGKIPIEAARRFGARAIGIEFNPDLAALARRNAQQAGVSDRVTIVTGDIFKEDFSHATVVTLYLLTQLNIKLKPTLLAMKPGTRIVSNTFAMGAWEPDAPILAEGEVSGYFWIVPAKVEGRWMFTDLPGLSEAQVQIRQKSQKFDGDVVVDQALSQRIEGRLRGAQISFDFNDGSHQPQTFVGIVSANKIHGTIKQIPGSVVTATRVQ